MGMAEAMEWLDKQIAWREEARCLKKFNGQISVCDEPEEKQIQIFGDIIVLSDLVGEKLMYEKADDKGILYFMYKGYKVFQLKRGWV